MHTQSRLQALILTLMLACTGITQAATPTTVSYQGYLTDPSGAALDGSFSIDFSIYTVSAGGVALWTSSKTVSVSKGLLSVQLGDTVLFPVGLFANPTFLGIDVDTDGEMSPRTVFDSVAFAFKANDAMTLEGSSAASLDQSAHVIDLTNPHAVTAAQTGAADAATLTAHTGDTGNPHSVTTAQIPGAATISDITTVISTHAGDSAAHHLRYNNGEAITAMGAKADGNALHHDQYTDASSVAAVLAADGAGSTLDADLVDGLEAADIISAASDEVRTPISSFASITTPGSYYLTGNMTATTNGINIDADNVTLDLMGFTLFGANVNDQGIEFSGQSNITIKNGTIRDFGRSGIHEQLTSSRFNKIVDMQLLGNGSLGSANQAYSGITINGTNNHIERCSVGNSGGEGIRVGNSSIVVNNTVYNSGGENGISTGAGAIISDNTIYNNARWGINASSINLIERNTLYFNNVSETANEGGLRVSLGSRVVGNMLGNNKKNNIYVAAGDNIIEANHVTFSLTGGFGINFAASGNLYRNNTAANNSTNFGGAGFGSTTDGGGNVAF